jgi:hypothetical protein
MSIAKCEQAVEYQKPLRAEDYVERGSSDQLAAEALNRLGFNLEINRKDLVQDGRAIAIGGVEISGTYEEMVVWEKLLSSPRVAIIRLAEGGWEIDDLLPEANFDPETETRVRAYSLHWQAIRERRNAGTTYCLNNSPWAREILGIKDPEAHEAKLKALRGRRVQESYQMTKEARAMLGDIKPLGKSDLIAIFQKEAETLYPNLTSNSELQKLE